MQQNWTQIVALSLLASICTPLSANEPEPLLSRNLQSAEALIDAFYSYDPDELQSFLTTAQSSAPALTYYQGWAEGGNYQIIARQPCEAESATVINCAITVQDDPVLALKTGFNVTDTFTITFADTRIVAVTTSSNDQQIYYDAFTWVVEQMPEVMSGPCQGFFVDGPTPGDCARAMTQGYRMFVQSSAYSRSMVDSGITQ